MDNFSWLSDWNGYEVGHRDSSVVGLYQLNNTNIYMYIDMETSKVLEYWNETDE
ncbi:hypothetical protein [Priestia megaterium]|uniref:hypothetical protein n=1 Tax=Priestia megaterium TaxID=1404 RepID=UPI0015D4EA5E|nr:hypothetical protein [Priestia megaterium]